MYEKHYIISDTYLIRGNNGLCKDLKSKIGSQARVFSEVLKCCS